MTDALAAPDLRRVPEGLGRARPGQPDRRAHRLQRRLRPAVRPAPAHRRRGVPPRTRPAWTVHSSTQPAGDAVTFGEPDRPARSTGWAAYAAGRGLGAARGRASTVPGARPAPRLRRARRRRAVLLRRAGVRGAHRAGRPRRAGPAGAELARAGPAGGERLRRHALRHHGPVRGHAAAASGHALFLDCRDAGRRAHPVRPGRRRAAPAGDRHPGAAPPRRRRVRRRRAACEAGRRDAGRARAARRHRTPAPTRWPRLDDEVLRRRVRHVVTENQRVLDDRRRCCGPAGRARSGRC